MKKIKIRGVIISNDMKWLYELFEIESTCPSDIETILAEGNGEEITVDINSGGGDVYSGSEIYTMLKNHNSRVVVEIPSIAASAASVIAMAGDVVRISPTAQIMIHKAASTARGNSDDMKNASEWLDGWDKSITNAYKLKTGLSQEELLDYMSKETWLNAQQAKELGFADEVMFDETNQLVANTSSIENFVFPTKVANKLRNLLKGNIDNEQQEPKVEPTISIQENIDIKALAKELYNLHKQERQQRKQKPKQKEPQNTDDAKKHQLQAKLNLLKLGGMSND